jgi:prevent-host-death family protein
MFNEPPATCVTEPGNADLEATPPSENGGFAPPCALEYSLTSLTRFQRTNMSTWQLQDAKARLSEVVKKAAQDGPQHITLHGAPAAVVLSAQDYQRLIKRSRPKRFVDFLRSSPLKGVDLELERDRSAARDIDL